MKKIAVITDDQMRHCIEKQIKVEIAVGNEIVAKEVIFSFDNIKIQVYDGYYLRDDVRISYEIG